ncbi:hypothetical protein [Pseudoclavibacter helvolus]
MTLTVDETLALTSALAVTVMVTVAFPPASDSASAAGSLRQVE